MISLSSRRINYMSKYFAVIASLVPLILVGQSGIVEFPYNPDSDGDDWIGVVDLLDLLGLYESSFVEDGLYLDESNTAALYYTGIQSFGMCHASCSDLPGKWRMMGMDDWSRFHVQVEQEVSQNEFAWLREQGWPPDSFGDPLLAVARHSNSGWQKGQLTMVSLEDMTNCFCAAKERPKVEYSYCQWTQTSEDQSFMDCCNEKVSNGWYPLGGISGVARRSSSASSYVIDESQAFWRWVD